MMSVSKVSRILISYLKKLMEKIRQHLKRGILKLAERNLISSLFSILKLLPG